MEIMVRKIRIEIGLSGKELASISGISASHISDIENGIKIPSIVVICKLAKALGVPPGELFSCDD